MIIEKCQMYSFYIKRTLKPDNLSLSVSLSLLIMDGFIDDLRVYALLNSNPVISGQWVGSNERLCAMEPLIVLAKHTPVLGCHRCACKVHPCSPLSLLCLRNTRLFSDVLVMLAKYILVFSCNRFVCKVHPYSQLP